MRRFVRVVAAVQAARPEADVLVTEGDKFLPALVASARTAWTRAGCACW